MPVQPKLLIHNIGNLLTMSGTAGLGVIQNAAVVVGTDGNILWSGPGRDLPRTITQPICPIDPSPTIIDASGQLVMPGQVDCHTHPFFDNEGFPRARDFVNGLHKITGYTAGGIYLTVKKTREAFQRRELFLNEIRRRLETMIGLGVTTLEAKTGYHLTIEGELDTLKMMQELQSPRLPWIIPTLLACHFVPPEYRDNGRRARPRQTRRRRAFGGGLSRRHASYSPPRSGGAALRLGPCPDPKGHPRGRNHSRKRSSTSRDQLVLKNRRPLGLAGLIRPNPHRLEMQRAD